MFVEEDKKKEKTNSPFPLEFRFKEGEIFIIQKGRIEGLLHRVVLRGDKINGKLSICSKFSLDLCTKVFGPIDNKGKII